MSSRKSALPSGGNGLTLQGDITVLYTIAVILVIAWLLGVAGTFTLGPILHVLLVVAVVLFVVGLVSGRRVIG